ncbi:MAG TPA: primase-helicase family protein [Pseudolabrys sp.]|nr:primase-helicase family protein [Pseudolabrys sp.]
MSEAKILPWNLPRLATPDTPPKSNGAAPEPSPQMNGTEVRLLHVTFFNDWYAGTLTTEDMAVSDLCDRILASNASKKDDLPWLKLAKFGNYKSKPDEYGKGGGCLRHDENVTAISGIEGDYDGEKMSFDDAVAILKKARLNFLIYTSPTHTTAKPRWRVLMPTSCDLPPVERENLLGRVNGLLGGIFSTESFTLSQSYYYGSVNKNPAHRAEYYSGDYIDERVDLDAGAIGKDEKEKANTSPAPPTVGDGAVFTLKSLKVRGISADVLHLIEHFTTPPDASDKLKAMNNGHRHFKVVAELRRYALSNEQIEQVYSLGLIGKAAAESPRGFKGYLAKTIKAVDARAGLSLGHFWSFGPMNQFFFVPSLALWPVGSVDARLRPLPVINLDGSPKLNKKDEQVYIPASKWLSQNRSVETMTWAPGQPSVIFNKAMSADGGLTNAPGFRCFNTYRAPPPPRGNVMEAVRWVDLVKKLYPKDAEHIFNYAAHRVQKPGDKINHCLVLLGVPGIGKDTLIAAILRAVGTWNCTEASPQDFFEAFNPHVRAVIMRINEAHDLGDVSRYSFYERTKIYAASPPETLPVNDKNIRKYYIPNVCGIIITSNYRTECLYLPADD